MFVTTPICVGNLAKVPSLSSASTTIQSDRPRRAFEPQSTSTPPLITVGSMPQAVSTWAVSEVVVVLPWVPVTAIVEQSRMISASISARWMMVSPRARAASSSGLPALTALEITIWRASPRFSGRWPTATAMPFACSRVTLAPANWSEPCTLSPRACRISAMALMPMPPMPMMWMGPVADGNLMQQAPGPPSTPAPGRPTAGPRPGARQPWRRLRRRRAPADRRLAG